MATLDGAPKTGPSVSQPDNEIDIQLSSVKKSFGAVTAVNRVSLEIRRGELITLLGPSGCGKTTILRLIAGFIDPDEGEICLKGRSVNGVPPYRRAIGMVFQNYALFPHKSIADNVAFGLRMRKIDKSRIKEEVAKALELVKLEGVATRYPHQLSGGQQQRVALARAIVIKPNVLLLDEPFGALDKKLRDQMQLELKSLQKALGVTTLFVTHDQEEALIISDRIAVLQAGNIEHIGAPEEVYEKPKSRFVSDFIGASNFFQGELRRLKNGDLIFVAEGNLTMNLKSPTEIVSGPEEAEVMVRPEKISIWASRPASSTLNLAEGEIADVIYLGSATQYLVKTGRKLVRVFEQNLQPERGPTYSVGDKVHIAWHPEHVLLVKS